MTVLDKLDPQFISAHHQAARRIDRAVTLLGEAAELLTEPFGGIILGHQRALEGLVDVLVPHDGADCPVCGSETGDDLADGTDRYREALVRILEVERLTPCARNIARDTLAGATR